MSKKDDVLSAISSLINAFAAYADELEVRVENLEQENTELRSRNNELGEVFTVAANILKRGNV